jgi:hypothetical protein
LIEFFKTELSVSRAMVLMAAATASGPKVMLRQQV